MAKAAAWAFTDAKTRKLGEQTGLDTLVVPALNYGHWTFPGSRGVSQLTR